MFLNRNRHEKLFLFVHIPKTGGTSIRSIIKDNWNRSYPYFHDPLFNLQLLNDIGDNIFKFCVVRNPYTRTFSYYKHFLRNNPQFNNWNFETFLYHLKKKVYFKNTPMIGYPQSFYVYDLNGDISLNVFNFENLVKLEKVLDRKLPILHNGGYNVDDYYQSYSKKNIETVKEMFSIDFDNFNYSTKFI